MRILRVLGAIAVGIGLVAQVAAAHAERRVALIIGNNKYDHLEPLQKAVADATAYADVLKAKGFDQVILKTDVSRSGMDEAIATFIDQIQPGDTAVFAYSGHGWSDGTQNYIVGTDAPKSGSQELLARISVPLKDGAHGVLDEMDRQGAALKVAIIDACRDNPFTPVPGKRGVGLSRGLARMEQAHGTFIVFSADAGQSALDGLSVADQDPNSVFSRVFVPLLRADLTLQDAVKTTQAKVVALARSINEDQQPAYYDGVIGSACLSANCTSAGMLSGPAPNPVSPDDLAWQRIASSGDPADFESFSRLFPESGHRAEAEAKAKSLRLAALEPPKKTPEPLPAATKPACEGLVASIGAAGVAAAAERCLKRGDIFKDCENCPEMVVIPAGKFTMGSPSGEKDRFDNEVPQHSVTIGAAFAVGKFAVTRGQFAAFVKDTGYDAGSKCRTFENGKGEERSSRSWRNPGFGQDDTHPAVCLSWNDAKAYVAWLSRKTGQGYRLLTEAEFEYASRAGTTTRYWFGDDESGLCANVNGADQTAKKSIAGMTWPVAPCSDGNAYTAPVGSFAANDFGLYDMSGNAWAWTEDCYHDSYASAPNDGSAWTSESCEYRVRRGGAWADSPRNLRAAARFRDQPGNRIVLTGFRVARTL
jgi:formylglycine-generating enzyme required for sulfatase activity